MPSRTVLARALLALFLLVLAAPIAARDMTEYGRYLGVRLKMYLESYEVLDKFIAEGTDAEKRKARLYRAEVMRIEADQVFATDGDAEAQRERYLEAVKIFGEGEPDTPADVYDKARLQVEIARLLQRGAPTEAQALCDAAIIACQKHYEELDKKRANESEWLKVYPLFRKLFYTLCQGYYVKALTYTPGTPENKSFLDECDKNIDLFQFSLEKPLTEELILSIELQGDVELARGKPEGAVGKFLYLVDLLNELIPNYDVGRLALENGYLRAVGLLTGELDFEPKNLNRAVDLYNDAFTRYGTVRGLEYQFKSLQLHRISAQIKLGDAQTLQAAVEQLLKLANDRDASFRRQAVSVLADIASREVLDNELRFRCAAAAYRDLEGMVPSVLIKLAQAHQALLAACVDVQTFETYAPACFERAGNIYSRMWRFLDAALVYREGATRTAYFLNKFSEDGKVPAHMLGRTDRIVDMASLLKYPGEMANEYARNARFLTDPRYGEPDNRQFKLLLDHANVVKAHLGGEDALRDKQFNDAFKRLQDRAYPQSAVRYANLPANYRKYYLGMVQAASAYMMAFEDSATQRITSGANADERESDQWFAAQKARHPEGMAVLPAEMWQGHEAHWDEIMKSQTPGRLAAWHKSVYYFKRYFLLEAARAWNEIQPLLAENPKADFIDAILAVAQHKAAQWLRANPSGRGDADGELARIGRAIYVFVYMARKASGDDAEVVARYRADAVRLLSPFLKTFGPHVDPAVLKVSLEYMVEALAESNDVFAAEAAYVQYRESYPDEGGKLERFVLNLNAAIRKNIVPQVEAMSGTSANLQSMANQLKKNSFQSVGPSYPEDAKRVAEAKSELEKQRALAHHFWNEWMINQVLAGKYGPEIARSLPDVKPTLQKKWDELAEIYPRQWGEAVRAELNKALKLEGYAAIAAEVRAMAVGTPDVELMDKMKAMSDAALKEQLASSPALSSLYTLLMIATEQLRYFQGAAFIYEFAAELNRVAHEIDERTRPPLSFVLKYYEEWRLRSGRAEEGLSQEDLRKLGRQYFMVRDWNQSVRYLDEYVKRFGGLRVWGPEEDIFVDTRLGVAGRLQSGDELAVKYMLGKSYLERYKLKKDPADLNNAARLMRRCWCFNIIRDAVVIRNQKFRLQYQKEMEDYYLYVGQDMAEIFELLFAAPQEIKIEWLKYVNRYTDGLIIHKDNPVQDVPADRAGMLWHAGQIQLRLWNGFKELEPSEQYKYRDEFRNAFLAWQAINIHWVETFGSKDMGIELIKGEKLANHFQVAVKRGITEQDMGSVYRSETTLAYVARVKELTETLAAACKKAGIALK